jgi:chemotaxis protein methyltransferase CheR
MDKFYSDIRELLYQFTGITLNDSKNVMIDNRIQKFIRDTKYTKDKTEIISDLKNNLYKTEFINAFTTNKTNFFREHFHFDDLKDRVLPTLFSENRDIKIYCSASSTGEEPYSISMTATEIMKLYSFRKKIIIDATDIDTEVLKTCKDGIYRVPSHLDFIPDWIKLSDYFKRRLDEKFDNEFYIKAKDDIKKLIRFQQMNLMSDNYIFDKNEFDVVFCRNVLIYFNQTDQNKILKKLFSLLKVGGTLYLGHSESPLDLSPYVVKKGYNIFIKVKEYNL